MIIHMYKDFHDLNIWKIGFTLFMKIDNLTLQFPEKEKYSLASQIRRSSNSIIANIAESHGRYSYADKKRVLYIARGELTETRSHLAVSRALKYISNDIFIEINEGYKLLNKELNTYIKSLK